MERTFTHMSKMSSTNANNLMADMISQYPQLAALRNGGATKTLLGTTAKQVLLQTQLIEEAVGLQHRLVVRNPEDANTLINVANGLAGRQAGVWRRTCCCGRRWCCSRTACTRCVTW